MSEFEYAGTIVPRNDREVEKKYRVYLAQKDKEIERLRVELDQIALEAATLATKYEKMTTTMKYYRDRYFALRDGKPKYENRPEPAPVPVEAESDEAPF